MAFHFLESDEINSEFIGTYDVMVKKNAGIKIHGEYPIMGDTYHPAIPITDYFIIKADSNIKAARLFKEDAKRCKKDEALIRVQANDNIFARTYYYK